MLFHLTLLFLGRNSPAYHGSGVESHPTFNELTDILERRRAAQKYFLPCCQLVTQTGGALLLAASFMLNEEVRVRQNKKCDKMRHFFIFDDRLLTRAVQ